MYSLGCVSTLNSIFPTQKYHYCLKNAGSAHAVIYSKKARNIILETDKNNIDIDAYLYPNLNSYTFYKPCAVLKQKTLKIGTFLEEVI